MLDWDIEKSLTSQPLRRQKTTNLLKRDTLPVPCEDSTRVFWAQDV